MTPRLTLPEELTDLDVIASASGGKDSTALLLALREAGIPFRAVFADTVWEAPETYAYLDLLRERVCPIDVVGTPGGMVGRARYRAGFPMRMGRWCTDELKLRPLKEYASGSDAVFAVGIRGEESARRAAMPETEDAPDLDAWVWRPILRWTIADVLEIHRRHGIPVNPLYQRGHERVGCYPCIFASKEETRLIALHSPERIDEIAGYEEEFTQLRAARNAEKAERYKHPRATFFSSRHGVKQMGIHEVVAWSRTDRGGRQLDLLEPAPRGGCMRWGLCETEPKDGDE